MVNLKFLFCIPLLLVSCVSFHSKPISPVRTLSDFQARKLDNPGLRKFLETNLKKEIDSWPLKTWDFETLSLVALYYHPDLDVARAQWDVAKAKVVTAGGRPNPSFQVLPELVSNAATGISPWILGFSLDIPIETAGKRGYRVREAKALSEAARLKIATVAWQIRSRLRDKLLDLYSARQAIEILQKETVLQEENLKLITARQADGAVSPLALAEAQVVHGQTLLSFQDAQKRAVEGESQVAEALGLPLEALQKIFFSFASFDSLLSSKNLPLGKMRQEALLNRPDILGALREYEASEASLQQEVAKQYPDIHLGPGYTWDQGSKKWALGLSFSLPIFNRNRGSIAEAEARRQEAAAKFIALQSHILSEIDRTWNGYQAAYQKWKAADALQSARMRQQKLLESIGGGAGEMRRVSYLNNLRSLNVIRLIRLDVFLNTQKALGLLEDAIQRPLEGEAFNAE